MVGVDDVNNNKPVFEEVRITYFYANWWICLRWISILWQFSAVTIIILTFFSLAWAFVIRGGLSICVESMQFAASNYMLYFSYRILIFFNVILVRASWTSVERCAPKMPDINRKYICIYLAAFLLFSPSSFSSPRLYIRICLSIHISADLHLSPFSRVLISLYTCSIFRRRIGISINLWGEKNCSIILMDCTCLIDFLHNYRMAGASVNIPAGGLEDLVMFTGAKLSHNHLHQHVSCLKPFFSAKYLCLTRLVIVIFRDHFWSNSFFSAF